MVAGGGFHVNMDAVAAAASFGQRYTTRRAMMPPPPPPAANMVFERSRDDCSLEKSSPMHQQPRPFSFAGALRSDGPPSSLLKESLIRGASSASGAGLARSHSQLHRLVQQFEETMNSHFDIVFLWLA